MNKVYIHDNSLSELHDSEVSFSSPFISLTDRGLFCEAGQFYIDPHRAVDTAIVTHAHSDHARKGSKKYFCARSGLGLLKARLGKNIVAEGIPYGQKINLGKVEVSFHPAGHILGSAQVRVESEGQVWVVSGDYKRDFDPSCEPFETVQCDTFITEATFGTPKYLWKKDSKYGEEMFAWWQENAASGYHSILFGYSLGKAQRILSELAPYARKPILIHETIHELTECYRQEGRPVAGTEVLRLDRMFEGELILAPPSALTADLKTKLKKYKTAFASGWMAGSSHQGYGENRYDHGFVLSDHADWGDLNRTILETGAKRVFVQHRNGTLIQHLRRLGIDAYPDSQLKAENYARLGWQNLSLW